MERRHYLMNWPTLTHHDGFYVVMRGKQYMLGHISEGSGDGETFPADHQQEITRPAYEALKAIAVKNLKLVRAAERNKMSEKERVRQLIKSLQRSLKTERVPHKRTLYERQIKMLEGIL